MGLRISFPGARNDDLMFPVEVLEDILKHLSIRDRLVARQVCVKWRQHIDTSIQEEASSKFVIKIEDTEEPVKYFNGSASNIWSQFRFMSAQLSRSSLLFWNNFSDQITHLDFFDCTFPHIIAGKEDECTGNCVNLKHLGLRHCNKYLMMGKTYFHIHKLFDLSNLESLDLSHNGYLNDFALLTLVTSSKALKSLNLTESKIAFSKAVFNRFYPRAAQGEVAPEDCTDFSDNVLTFHMLYFAYLGTDRSASLREIILDGTRVDAKALEMLANPEFHNWTSVSLNNCSEVKVTGVLNFLKQQQNIKKLAIESSQFEFHSLPSHDINLSQYEHLVVSKNGTIKNVEFLQLMPNLQHLDMSSCANIELDPESFSRSGSLKVLKLRSIIPFYDMNRNNTIASDKLASVLSRLSSLVELDLGVCGSAVTDPVMQAIIQNMPNLQILKLCQSRITDRGVAGVELDDFDSRLSPSTIMRRRGDILERNRQNPPGCCLSRLVHLKHIDFSTCRDLSEATWKVALKLPDLTYLDLSFCGQISTSGLLAIVGNCPDLETLNIIQCGLHITGNQELLDTTKRNLKRLRNLIL